MPSRSLVRASTLTAFRDALCRLALDGEPLAVRRRAVIVPTRASAELLRRTFEAYARRRGRPTLLLPDLLTRDEWLVALHRALPAAPPLLARLDRDVIMGRAARAAGRRGSWRRPPFELRPGLVAAMVDFYDELHRRQRSVRRFSGALFDQLRVERDTDKGSEALIRQTCFLAFAFLGYERGVAASGGIDEHGLRRTLLAGPAPAAAFDHVIVGVADHPTDPRGLWPADFDLLGRQPLARLDVVVTDETHDAGFRERVEQELPGIEEVRATVPAEPPTLVRPAAPEGTSRPTESDASAWCVLSRDREDELRDVARLIRRRFEAAPGVAGDPVAIVCHRPLPYLYLGQQVLTEARLPYLSFDALPLGAEPYTALLDLVLACARTGGTREAAVALLRSRLLRFEVDGVAVGLRDVAALEHVLGERRALGEADTYGAEVAAFFGDTLQRDRVDRARAARAAAAAVAIRHALQGFRTGAAASAQLRTVGTFLRGHERPGRRGEEATDRQSRARGGVLGLLDGLARAFERHDDGPRRPEELVAAVHHAIEAHTFSPRRGTHGVHLVDAVAARFGEFAHAHIVGLVETDWPERPHRSIFYTSGLLKALGWPQERDHLAAQQASFRDLLRLPSKTVYLHAFQLEGDAVVARSPMIDAAGELPWREDAPLARRRIFDDEVLTGDVQPPGLESEPAEWLLLRRDRPALSEPAYHGVVLPQAPQAYRVSRVDRYVDCPFKYFSETVLGLPEEREDSSGLTPLERGTLVHELFERFYHDWQADGRGTITPALLPEALERFQRLTREALAHVPEADRVLEETRLLGSIVSRGLAERVFELESDAGGTIVERLVEVDLRDTFVFPQLNGLSQRPVAIRGKADRVDVFDHGGLRVIDYKLGRLPDVDRSVQVGVYAHSAQQMLEARDGRPHPVRSAMYIAFGDDRRLEGSLGRTPEEVAYVVGARASDFAGAIERIEAGQFPARPHRPVECQYCRYAGVCRKEYAGEADAPAGSV